METNHDWQAAMDDTVALWRKIRQMVEEPDELELLTEINAVCDLCEVAQAAAPQAFGRCERCIMYQQFGGCRGINAEMSECVVAGDWDKLLTLIDRFVGSLEAAEVPLTAELDS